MANKIYKEGTDLIPALDSFKVAERYNEQISIIANCLSKLGDVEGVFDYLSKATNDNGDPHFMMGEALRELGKVLACAVEYRDEYLKEAQDNEDDEVLE